MTHTFRSSKMDNIPILLEHVHLLNGLDRLDIKLLKRGLQFLVIGAGGLMDFLLFSARGAFPSTCQESVSLSFFFSVVIFFGGT